MPPLTLVQLAQRPDLLAIVAGWIYQEWWRGVEGASVATLSDLLRAHSVVDQLPLTLVALAGIDPVGTATLLAHDVDTEAWAQLSPWMAAVYVVPGERHRGVGTALVNGIVARAGAIGIEALYLATVGHQAFYARLKWTVVDRSAEVTVMKRLVAGQM